MKSVLIWVHSTTCTYPVCGILYDVLGVRCDGRRRRGRREREAPGGWSKGGGGSLSGGDGGAAGVTA